MIRRWPSVLFAMAAFGLGCFMGDMMPSEVAGQAGDGMFLSEEGTWQSDGETLTLEAEPGQYFLALRTVVDPAAPAAPPRLQGSWVAPEREPLKLDLADFQDLFVVRVTGASRWDGVGLVFLPCTPPPGCPFPPEPDPF